MNAVLVSCVMFASPSSAQLPGEFSKVNVQVVLDSSGSMWAQQEGRTKLEASRDVLKASLDNLPPGAHVGLMTFGHRRKNDCSDIELLVPIGSKTPAEILDMAAKLQPKGITPISEALRQAAMQLKPHEGAKMILLISDGGEECEGDPCAVTRKLAEEGMLVRVNVVGLNVTEKSRKELQCIAKEGAGKLFEVTDKVSLYKVMEEVKEEVETFPETMAPKPEPVVEKPVDTENLLLASEGASVVKAGIPGWEKTISGSDGAYLWALAGQEVVFAFKGEQPVSVSRFAIGIRARRRRTCVLRPVCFRINRRMGLIPSLGATMCPTAKIIIPGISLYPDHGALCEVQAAFQPWISHGGLGRYTGVPA